jgi:polyphosphate kinase
MGDTTGVSAQQQFRFLMRIHDPLKQWKLSPMDLQSRSRWEQYTKAKEEMLHRTHIPEAPWVGSRGRRQEAGAAQLHLTSVAANPLCEIDHESVNLPDRIHDPTYRREKIPPDMYVPAIF